MKHLQSIDIEIDIIVVSSLVFSLLEKKKISMKLKMHQERTSYLIEIELRFIVSHLPIHFDFTPSLHDLQSDVFFLFKEINFTVVRHHSNIYIQLYREYIHKHTQKNDQQRQQFLCILSLSLCCFFFARSSVGISFYYIFFCWFSLSFSLFLSSLSLSCCFLFIHHF